MLNCQSFSLRSLGMPESAQGPQMHAAKLKRMKNSCRPSWMFSTSAHMKFYVLEHSEIFSCIDNQNGSWERSVQGTAAIVERPMKKEMRGWRAVREPIGSECRPKIPGSCLLNARESDAVRGTWTRLLADNELWARPEGTVRSRKGQLAFEVPRPTDEVLVLLTVVCRVWLAGLFVFVFFFPFYLGKIGRRQTIHPGHAVASFHVLLRLKHRTRAHNSPNTHPPCCLLFVLQLFSSHTIPRSSVTTLRNLACFLVTDMFSYNLQHPHVHELKHAPSYTQAVRACAQQLDQRQYLHQAHSPSSIQCLVRPGTEKDKRSPVKELYFSFTASKLLHLSQSALGFTYPLTLFLPFDLSRTYTSWWLCVIGLFVCFFYFL